MHVPSMPFRLLAVMVLLAASACTDVRSAGTTVRVGGEQAEGRPACPLTGKAARSEADVNRPALAVKIENSANARPQTGLAQADLVYEEPVEGGLAWFVAVFQCSDPDLAGPVRNAHPTDAGLVAPHGPAVFAHAGATPAVIESLTSSEGVQQIDARLGGDAFQRSADRPIPHNLYVSVPKLRELAKKEAPPKPWISFRVPDDAAKTKKATGSPSPTGRKSGTSVQFTQAGSVVRYAFDEKAGRYVRQQGTPPAPFLDEVGNPVHITNLLFLWVDIAEGETRDAAGNRTPIVALTGKGDALLLRDGREASASWSRESLGDPPALRDAKGRPLLLSPGNTWIHLLPKDLPVFVR
jgi:hypothetical protein